jgi:hypothetical protein
MPALHGMAACTLTTVELGTHDPWGGVFFQSDRRNGFPSAVSVPGIFCTRRDCAVQRTPIGPFHRMSLPIRGLACADLNQVARIRNRIPYTASK